MSFTSQLLGNSTSGLSVSERAAQSHEAFLRGMFVNEPSFLDVIDRKAAISNAKLFNSLSPEPINASFGRTPTSDLAKQILTSDNVRDSFSSLVDGFKTTSSASSGATYSANRSTRNSAKTVDYLEADLAKHYGMDASAAYGEALQNTAYRRAVADLKAAGLNPVLAVSGMNPAGSYVSGNTLARASGSGSSGAVSSASGKYAMSSNLYNAIGAAASIVGAVVGFKTGTGPFKWMNASTVSSLAKSLTQSAIQGYGSLFGSK